MFVTEPNGAPMSPAPETNGDVKPNISQIKREPTPVENQGTPNPNHSLGTPNPNHSLGTPNPNHSLGTPNPAQPMDVVKEERPSTPRETKPNVSTVVTAALNPVQIGFGEILNCAYHRDVIIQLATILQVSIIILLRFETPSLHGKIFYGLIDNLTIRCSVAIEYLCY